MKTNRFFAAALAATLLLASCSKDNGEPSGIVPNGDATYARISLTQTSATPSPRGFQDGAAAQGAEKEIKSVYLYVFNASKVLEKTVPFIVGTDFTNNGATATKTFETTTGTHFFYVVINPPTGAFTVADGCTLAAFEKTIGTFAAMSDVANATTGYLMTSVKGAVAQNLVLAEESEAVAKNKVELEVGRAFGKVSVEFVALPADMPEGTLSNVEYRVMSNPKQMYLMPVFEGGLLKTPLYGATYAAANYFDESAYLAADGQRANNYYVMENSNTIGLKGTNAVLRIRGKFTPKAENTFEADGTTLGTLDVSGTFYRLAYEGADGLIMGYDSKYYSEVPTPAADQRVLEFTNGISYYYQPLKNPGFAGQAVYTVVRNTYFQVSITKVSGAFDPGEPTGDPWDPKEPFDPTKTYMNAVITIVPWTVIPQNSEL